MGLSVEAFLFASKLSNLSNITSNGLCVSVVEPVHLLIYPERTLSILQRAVQVALGLENLADVVGVYGHCVMVGPVHLLIDP